MNTVERRLLHAIIVAALIAAAPASARTYKWVDANGTTHYSQTMPSDPSVEAVVFEPEVDPGVDTESLAVTGTRACRDMSCRLARLRAQRQAETRAEDEKRAAAAKAASDYPVWPTPVAETDDEKIARLVAECKRNRGSHCDSDREKRRMLLQNVELTQAERRALRGLSPRLQRRVLLERIPKRYRDID